MPSVAACLVSGCGLEDELELPEDKPDLAKALSGRGSACELEDWLCCPQASRGGA